MDDIQLKKEQHLTFEDFGHENMALNIGGHQNMLKC